MPGKRFGSQAQNLVINLLEYFIVEKENERPLTNIDSIQEKVVGELKIRVKTVSDIKIRKEKNPILRSTVQDPKLLHMYLLSDGNASI